jgi:hypothetical protein
MSFSFGVLALDREKRRTAVIKRFNSKNFDPAKRIRLAMPNAETGV